MKANLGEVVWSVIERGAALTPAAGSDYWGVVCREGCVGSLCRAGLRSRGGTLGDSCAEQAAGQEKRSVRAPHLFLHCERCKLSVYAVFNKSDTTKETWAPPLASSSYREKRARRWRQPMRYSLTTRLGCGLLLEHPKRKCFTRPDIRTTMRRG